MQFEASVSPYEQADVHALAVAVFKDENIDGFLQKLDELSGGLVKSAIDAKEVLGKEGETAYFHLVRNSKLKAQRLLLVGVGDAGEYKVSTVSQMAGTAVRTLRTKNAKTIAIVPRSDGDPQEVAESAVEGSLIATFDPDKYRTVDKEEKNVDRIVISLEGAKQDVVKNGINVGRIIGESVNFTRDLANEPGASM